MSLRWNDVSDDSTKSTLPSRDASRNSDQSVSHRVIGDAGLSRPKSDNLDRRLQPVLSQSSVRQISVRSIQKFGCERQPLHRVACVGLHKDV